jgi:steroid delta-isomerase-like uncharacterized protein
MATHTTVTPGVDVEWLAGFADRYLAAWNSHDADRVLECMTDDIVYDDAAWPTQMRGHDDVRDFVTAIWRAMPDLAFQVVEGPYVVADKPKAAFHWRATGMFTGPLEPPGFAPTGRSMEIEGVDFHEYRDGKIARLRIDFDMLDATRQLGLMPPAGSGAERAIATVQRVSHMAIERARHLRG